MSWPAPNRPPEKLSRIKVRFGLTPISPSIAFPPYILNAAVLILVLWKYVQCSKQVPNRHFFICKKVKKSRSRARPTWAQNFTWRCQTTFAVSERCLGLIGVLIGGRRLELAPRTRSEMSVVNRSWSTGRFSGPQNRPIRRALPISGRLFLTPNFFSYL
jgi:hypothetical protein